MARAAVVVLDACGVGALPDAAEYEGDEGSNTLGHLAERVGGLDLPTLERLGLGSIVPIRGVAPAAPPVVHGRLHPLGPGKESTTGHWELMGVVPQQPLPTYPDGFPPEVVETLERVTGLRFCCNRPYSGTEVIEDFGEHHLETGEVILYTSADSVLQLAAHVDVLSEPELYAACEAARAALTGEHAVGRVIARPFEGRPGDFRRREGRRDYAAPPPGRSYLEEIQDAGHRCTRWARSATCSPASGSTSSTTAPPTPRASRRPRELLARAGLGPDLREPGGDRPDLRPPARRRGLSPSPAARSTPRWRAGSISCAKTICSC